LGTSILRRRNDGACPKSLYPKWPVFRCSVVAGFGCSLTSPEFGNMFVKLVEYFTRYQNQHVKHNDAVIEDEMEFIIEITSSFMKHVVKLSGR
jgi:hypothetical protein